ncbi:hypothetical protein N0V95_001745 [Ascochyta clinopodiicola]|nr:hypothetical protein N0V95_001745 [Ascochyta clinopodiicola]
MNTHLLFEDGQDVPSVAGGVLWPDPVNKLFYLFGGEHDSIAELQSKDGARGRFALWSYDIIYNIWNTTYDNSQSKIRWPVFGTGTVSDAGKAYYYGGYLTNASDIDTKAQPIMQNALITYDMDKREWRKDEPDRTPRAQGSLHYIPASHEGMLVYFGGLEQNSTGTGAFYTNMSQIRLYDIADSRWYTQTATGDVPSPRRGFCADVVWAKDKSSYNIYLYGGIGNNGDGFDDLYVLSIPSFQWILIVGRVGGNVNGNAASTKPMLGWDNIDLAKYLGTTATVQSRTATRPIPSTSATDHSPSPPLTKKTNVGAIAGGAVGGAVVFTLIVALVFFCLRSRRRSKAVREQSQLPEVLETPNAGNPDAPQKSVATHEVQGGTPHSSMPQPPTYSFQGSPPPSNIYAPNAYHQNSPSPHLTHHSGDWGHQNLQAQGNYAYQQPYYPPPPEPSQSPKESNPHTMIVELPNVRSPANAEMAEVRSPVPGKYP